MNFSRREFMNRIGLATVGFGVSTLVPGQLQASLLSEGKFTFEISLAQFSFASEIYTGKMTMLDFPQRAVNEFEINVLEYVSGFFNNKHTDATYMKELKQICDDLGVKNHLIMVDGDNLAALDSVKRKKAVESHYPWVDAAKYLGCSAIRVNLGDAMAVMTGKGEEGSAEDTAKAAVEGYGNLLEYAEKSGMNVIVENHFGYSSNPEWLVGILNQINSKNKGLLPDFGNFCLERSKPASFDLPGFMKTTCLKEYDKYEGVKKMMPFAKGISAKTHTFGSNGEDLETDFIKMFNLIKASGWTGGYVGIEYEGGLKRDMGGDPSFLPNDEGIKATKKLLESVLEKMK